MDKGPAQSPVSLILYHNVGHTSLSSHYSLHLSRYNWDVGLNCIVVAIILGHISKYSWYQNIFVPHHPTKLGNCVLKKEACQFLAIEIWHKIQCLASIWHIWRVSLFTTRRRFANSWIFSSDLPLGILCFPSCRKGKTSPLRQLSILVPCCELVFRCHTFSHSGIFQGIRTQCSHQFSALPL